jgi:hypothetical protein
VIIILVSVVLELWWQRAAGGTKGSEDSGGTA